MMSKVIKVNLTMKLVEGKDDLIIDSESALHALYHRLYRF